jgi:spore germination protein YaaH
MAKKIFLILGVFFILLSVVFFWQKTNKNKLVELLTVSPIPISPKLTNNKKLIENKIMLEKKSIFVPYWNLTDGLKTSLYDRYFYFGVTFNQNGLDKNEAGFLNLEKFINLVQPKQRFLTLRLLNDDFNRILIKDKSLQDLMIKETKEILEEFSFKGVLIDLELKEGFGFSTEELVDDLNQFYQHFYQAIKAQNKDFLITVYGDNFYRKRPYDLKFLSKNADEIIIMAYDFHKSWGEPGANFPFSGKEKYGYDFKTMIDDFLFFLPADKITVAFGMYGYDWLVDEKKRPISQAKALTLKKIKEEFLAASEEGNFSCKKPNCLITQDQLSKENEINYVISSSLPDDQGIYRLNYHILWFEDEKSAAVKIDYLKKHGIFSFAFWAWGYF